jgi:hypothetical protein
MMVCRHMPRPALYHLFDPDRFDADVDKQREYRQRFIPSGLAHAIYLDTWLRMASFEPGVPYPKRLFDAYAAEQVKRVDTNGDGVISAAEGDPDASSDGFADNNRLFLPATSFRRFAVTREIDDGYLAPRFAPSTRGWVLSGNAVTVSAADLAGCDRRPGRTARLRQLCRAARRAPHGPASVGSLTMAWLVFCYPVAWRPHGAYNHHHQETA